jgi:tRNA(fMet)-specific endonuclease VapC
VEHGERLTVTRDGRQVAELRPLGRRPPQGRRADRALVSTTSIRSRRASPGPRSGNGLPSLTERGVLDTSAVVLVGCLRAYDLPEEPVITAATLAELSVGPLVATTRKERAARQGVLQQAEADFQPLPVDADAARAFGRVAASLRACGRKLQARSYDVMIAATAIANELPLYTVNPDDFSAISHASARPSRGRALVAPRQQQSRNVLSSRRFRQWGGYNPTFPSMRSRKRSAWPMWRAYSSIM